MGALVRKLEGLIRRRELLSEGGAAEPPRHTWRAAGQGERSALPLMGKVGEGCIDLAAAGETVRPETQFFLNLLVSVSTVSL